MNIWTLFKLISFPCSVFVLSPPSQLSERAHEHPGFVLHLILEDGKIKFEPEFKQFEEVLINPYEFMLRSISLVPRVETKLFPEWVRGYIYVCV